jgi:hypothetical protein
MQIPSVPNSLNPVTTSRPPRLAESILGMEVAKGALLQRDSEARPRKRKEKRKENKKPTIVRDLVHKKSSGMLIRLYVIIVD